MKPTERTPRDPVACQIIDALGGTVAVADLCEVKPGAVSNWKREGIPKPRLQYLKLARPDAFVIEDAEPSTEPA
jgi:hypothetical protein